MNKLIIGEKEIVLTDKELALIEDGLYRAVYLRQTERSKKFYRDGEGKMNYLGEQLYQEEQEYEAIRTKIDDARGGIA